MSDPKSDEISIGLVIVTHADYGAALLRAAELIVGTQEQCGTVSVDGTQEVTETVARLKETVARVDLGRGVLILTDMFGGTPTNLSLSLLSSGNVEVLTGVNLPMLLKAFGSRKLDLQKVAEEAKNAGDKGIVVAGEILRRKVKNG